MVSLASIPSLYSANGCSHNSLVAAGSESSMGEGGLAPLVRMALHSSVKAQ